MKIVVAGGTGLVGKAIVNCLLGARHDVVVLCRNAAAARKSINASARLDVWDGKTPGPWCQTIDGADAVLNFAGESIGAKRWSPARKRIILHSRLDPTKALVEAIRNAVQKPSVLINASAVGYYGNVEEEEVTESRPQGEGFLADVCGQWEREANVAETLGVRVITTRSGVVLAKDAPALQKMMLPFKFFVGGPVGSGRQWFSWIHIDDLTALVSFALTNGNLSGPVNVVAPESVTMRQVSSALGKAMQRPSWAPAPSFVLRILLGEMSEIVLNGQKVVPAKIMQSGFSFRFPNLAGALADVAK